METGVSVYDAMTRNPIIVDENASLIECAKKMKKEDVGSLLVKRNNKLIGIITEEDFVRKAILENLDTKKTKVKDIMTANVISTNPNNDLADAMNLMKRHNIRHLPVVEKNKIIGIITSKDILKIQPDLLEIYIEKLELEEKNKLISSRFPIKGACDICNKEAILRERSGQLVCQTCETKLR